MFLPPGFYFGAPDEFPNFLLPLHCFSKQELPLITTANWQLFKTSYKLFSFLYLVIINYEIFHFLTFPERKSGSPYRLPLITAGFDKCEISFCTGSTDVFFF